MVMSRRPPNAPVYLLSVHPAERNTYATAEGRQEEEEQQLNEQTSTDSFTESDGTSAMFYLKINNQISVRKYYKITLTQT